MITDGVKLRYLKKLIRLLPIPNTHIWHRGISLTNAQALEASSVS